MTTPWISDLVREINPAKLTRDQFVAKYFPQYVKEWRPDYRIKMRPDGRPTRLPTKGDAKCQQTKRTNRIDAAYSEYCALFDANTQTRSKHYEQS